MGEITGDALLKTAVVLFFLMESIKVVGGAVDTVKGWFSPAAKAKKIKETEYQRYFENDNRRIVELENSKREQHKVNIELAEGQQMTIQAVFAILKHARTNNSTGLMDNTIDDLQAYLNEKSKRVVE